LACEVIAHRGASAAAPENTLAALRAARAAGVRRAEVDVQRTSDGVLVLVHDATWLRTGSLERPVAMTPWSAIATLDVGSWFAPQFCDERPPTLDRILADTDLDFDLEIKSPAEHPGLARDIVEAVRKHGAERRVVLTCFDRTVVESLATTGLEVGYLSEAPIRAPHPMIRTCALHHDVVTRDSDYVRRLCDGGVRVWVWTVDDPALAQAMEAAGCQGVITNQPARLLAAARRSPRAT
jgi:glycerophosphoryl diester phosphodiesterase